MYFVGVGRIFRKRSRIVNPSTIAALCTGIAGVIGSITALLALFVHTRSVNSGSSGVGSGVNITSNGGTNTANNPIVPTDNKSDPTNG